MSKILDSVTGNQKQAAMALCPFLTIAHVILYMKIKATVMNVKFASITKTQQGKYMITAKKRPIKACAFDLGNTLINDTRLAKSATVDMAQWLLNKSIIQSNQAFLAVFERVNHGTEKPFISHTFGEIAFFEETFEELAIHTITAEEALKKYRELLMKKIEPDKDVADALQFKKKQRLSCYFNKRAFWAQHH